jgi:hypothetical protein
MTDISRSLGNLEARMGEHEKRLDRLDEKVDAGFAGINRKLDALGAAENQRKGAMWLLRFFIGGAGLAGLYRWWHG